MGVCEGIAKAVKVLCDALGLWCMIVICGNNPEKGIKYRHTWNIVKLGGKYYHMDVTFDNSLSHDGIRYDYFNLDDKNIFRDHEPLIAPAPHCTDGDHFYYREKKLSFTKQEDVYKRALQTAKKGRVFTFHWRGEMCIRDRCFTVQLSKIGFALPFVSNSFAIISCCFLPVKNFFQLF